MSATSSVSGMITKNTSRYYIEEKGWFLSKVTEVSKKELHKHQQEKKAYQNVRLFTKGWKILCIGLITMTKPATAQFTSHTCVYKQHLATLPVLGLELLCMLPSTMAPPPAAPPPAAPPPNPTNPGPNPPPGPNSTPSPTPPLALPPTPVLMTPSPTPLLFTPPPTPAQKPTPKQTMIQPTPVSTSNLRTTFAPATARPTTIKTTPSNAIVSSRLQPTITSRPTSTPTIFFRSPTTPVPTRILSTSFTPATTRPITTTSTPSNTIVSSPFQTTIPSRPTSTATIFLRSTSTHQATTTSSLPGPSGAIDQTTLIIGVGVGVGACVCLLVAGNIIYVRKKLAKRDKASPDSISLKKTPVQAAPPTTPSNHSPHSPYGDVSQRIGKDEANEHYTQINKLEKQHDEYESARFALSPHTPYGDVSQRINEEEAKDPTAHYADINKLEQQHDEYESTRLARARHENYDNFPN